MYLANDVIQNSKKKGPEFGKEFATVLPKAFDHMKGFDDKTRERLGRLLQIWEERGVYDKSQIVEFKAAFNSATNTKKEPGTPPLKKKKVESEKVKVIYILHLHLSCYFIELFLTLKYILQKEKKERKKSETEVEVDGTKELHVTLSPRTPGGDPPETEELIKALMVHVIFILAKIIIDYVTMPINSLYFKNENLKLNQNFRRPKLLL